MSDEQLSPAGAALPTLCKIPRASDGRAHHNHRAHRTPQTLNRFVNWSDIPIADRYTVRIS